MTTSTLERTEGLATLNKAIASIKDTIEEAGGIFNIHKQVRQRKEKRIKRRAPGMYPVLRHTILLWYSHKVEKSQVSLLLARFPCCNKEKNTTLYRNFDSDDTTLNTN